MELKEISMQERILDKARELFFFFGIKSISMDDIAKHLSISKKTLYTHYRDKSEIVHTIMIDLLSKYDEEMLLVSDKAENAVEEVVLHVKVLYAVFRDLKPNVFFEVEKYFPELACQFLNHRYSCVLKGIKENLQRGKAEGLFRDDLEVPFTAQIRLNQLVSAFDEKTYETLEYSVEKILNKITSFYLNAICSSKGKKLIATHIKF